MLIDCSRVPRELCLDDQLLMETMAQAAREAGATVVSQIRYRFGDNSPAGCTAVVMLDESHCSVHTYADIGLLAMDIFTCGQTDPRRVWNLIRRRLSLDHASVRELPRFETLTVSRQTTADATGPGRSSNVKAQESIAQG